MKIGILSLVLHTNYGGILQSYALQTVLERMGHDVVVLNRDRNIPWSLRRHIINYSKYLIKRYIQGRKTIYKSLDCQNRERQEREQFTQAFIDRYIHTRMVNRLSVDSFDDIEAVVVGSDQVWRSIYFKKQWRTGISDAFLGFLDSTNKKRIAYAASFGTDEWEYTEEETSVCSRLLQKFDAVCVRETSGITICQEKLGYINAKLMLDPTMLLSKEDYIQLVNNANMPNSNGNLLCYVLDDNANIQELINKIAHEKKLMPFIANSQVNNAKLPNKERIQPPVEQWLRGFMDAEFVVTDSFHACIFSILFQKPFVVIGNKKRGYSRFESLLKLFGLEKRLIENVTQFDSSMLNPISGDVYRKLDIYRNNSTEFLKEALTY